MVQKLAQRDAFVAVEFVTGAVVLLLLIGLIAFVGWLVHGLPRESRAAGGVAVALPGMIGDAFASVHFAQLFPNAAPGLNGLFAGLMLVARLSSAPTISRRKRCWSSRKLT